MRDPKKYAVSQAHYWLNKCYDLGFTAEEIVAESVTKQPVTKRLVTIEKGKEKRDIPPTPPIESKEKQKDNRAISRAREESSEDRAAFDQFFEAFWTAYPVGHKTNKTECIRRLKWRFMQSKDRAAFVNSVLGGLDKWNHSERWAEGFIINPESFINQERWGEEPPKPRPRPEHHFRKVGGISQTANTKLKGGDKLW